MLKEIINQNQTPIIPHSKPYLTAEDRAAIDKVLTSGMIAEGELVDRFEQKVSTVLGVAGGIAASSGTSALFLALKGLDIAQGDEVIIPSYVCRSVWDAVSAAGATPVLCDIEEDWCMSVNTVKRHVTKKTKAIIVVHIFGIVADAASICSLGIPVIEDCCQAIGAQRENKKAGTFGQVCIVSFHATKLLSTGEGGMVLSNDRHLLGKIRDLKQGQNGHLTVRYLYPMTDLQAALGLSQLAQYNDFLDRRRTIADYYFSELKEVSFLLPHAVRNRSIFFRFPSRTTEKFEKLQPLFYSRGIHIRKGVDAVLHRLWAMNPDLFPTTEKIFLETFCIPIYPALHNEECEKIATACRDLFLK